MHYAQTPYTLMAMHYSCNVLSAMIQNTKFLNQPKQKLTGQKQEAQ